MDDKQTIIEPLKPEQTLVANWLKSCPKFKPTYKTGLVELLLDTLEIKIKMPDCNSAVYLDLEECTNSAQVLDYIFHYHKKGWMTPDIMHDVLEAFDSAFYECHGNSIQGCLCPYGTGKTVGWKSKS